MTDLHLLIDLGAKLLKTLNDDQLTENKVPQAKRLDWLRRRIQCIHGMICEHCLLRDLPSAPPMASYYERAPLKQPKPKK